MKNLLLIFAIFMFACGSETEVAEESTPITEELELEPIIEQLRPLWTPTPIKIHPRF